MGETITQPAAWDFKAIHPDPATAREVVIDKLLGALAEATGGLKRALDFNAGTPDGLAIKHDVRHALARAEKALAWRGPGQTRWASAEAEPEGYDGP